MDMLVTGRSVETSFRIVALISIHSTYNSLSQGFPESHQPGRMDKSLLKLFYGLFTFLAGKERPRDWDVVASVGLLKGGFVCWWITLIVPKS